MQETEIKILRSLSRMEAGSSCSEIGARSDARSRMNKVIRHKIKVIRQIKITMIASWVSLIVCFPVYLYISLTALDTVLIGDEKSDTQNIREILLTSDWHSLRERAAFLVQQGHIKSKLSMLLCNLALVGFLVAMTCSIVIILQTRKLKKQTDYAQLHL